MLPRILLLLKVTPTVYLCLVLNYNIAEVPGVARGFLSNTYYIILYKHVYMSEELLLYRYF